MRTYACDFETTTDNPNKVEVWSACEIEVGKRIKSKEENCMRQNSIENFMSWITKTIDESYDDITLYFHNLKFDGSYILDYLIKSHKWKLCATRSKELYENIMSRKEFKYTFKNGMFTYCVSDKNVMYYIKLKHNKFTCTIKDSLKLMPFELRKIAKDFETEHKKLEMRFENKYPGYTPTEDELHYIYNDVLVLKEALEKYSEMTNEDISEIALTIGSHCMKQYKHEIDYKKFQKMFPSQVEEKTPCGDSFDSYIRKSYKGGWCYLKPEMQYKIINEKGYVFDVNSLYPSVMHSSSDCFYPVGKGHFIEGEPSKAIIDLYNQGKIYFFIRFSCEFEIKENHLPTIQIKGTYEYNPTEWLISSDIIDHKRENRHIPNQVTLTLTCTDYFLFLDHYNIKNVSYDSYIYYKAKAGLFDEYINYWYTIKKNSKGSMRSLAKLMLNNLYGKFSTSVDADYITYSISPSTNSLIADKVHPRKDAERAVYIPVGSAITSWARNFTIRHAQANFDHFIYADTDSLHMTGNKKDANDIKESPTELCCWKNESNWDYAIFSGQKRYIEHVTHEDGNPVDSYYNVKCCGMGKEAKKELIKEIENKKKTLSDFRPGLVVPGNLKGHRVDGGIYLQPKNFTFRKKRYEMI